MPTTKPYEILMRWNDQSQTWALHARSLTTLDDGTVVEGKAVPLVGLSDPAFTEVAALVSASKDNEIAALTAERDSLQSQLTAMTTERDTAVSELASANERIATLETRIAELTAEPEVPIVSRRQARLALLEMGFFEQVESAVYDGSKAVQIEYEADAWSRDNPTLIAMAKSLGMGDEQIDQFFALAGSK